MLAFAARVLRFRRGPTHESSIRAAHKMELGNPCDVHDLGQAVAEASEEIRLVLAGGVALSPVTEEEHVIV
jgi:hypothetical protein